MEHHWNAFSFVDRITSADPQGRIRGTFLVPTELEAFPLSLAGEAVGQLAAWAAMAAVDFRRRPVAGIAGRVEFLSEVQPGQRLELAADLETVDEEAASYSGVASIDGAPVIRLDHCVGPMLAVADLDDPRAVRERYALLRDEGAVPGRFAGLPALRPAPGTSAGNGGARATLAVPADAPLFADHFPRRPVFPGSLLMQAKLDLVRAWLGDLPVPAGADGWRLTAVSDMKLRSFVPPGALLELEVRLSENGLKAATATVEARAGTRMVGVARVQLAGNSAT